VRPFLGERRWTVAHLDPLHAGIIELARLCHVPQIFVAGNRSAAERSISDRAGERISLFRFYPRRHQITHDSIVLSWHLVCSTVEKTSSARKGRSDGALG